MFKKILLTVVTVFAATAMWAQGGDRSLFEREEYVNYGATLPYRIMYPEKMKAGEKYPLFIMLHGMGKRGTDNDQQLDLGGNFFLRNANRKKYPCIVLYPQAPETSAFVRVKEKNTYLPGGWQKFTTEGLESGDLAVEFTVYGKMIHEVIENIISSGTVDTKRIYIAGISMGGYTTYQMLASYPDLFAAAAVMSGATPLPDVEKWAGKVPVWIIHGDEDKIVPVDGARGVLGKLEEAGVEEYKYTEYQGAGHGVWGKAFADPTFMQWFFSFSK